MFKNEYHLDLDIKFQYTSLVPVFRRGDTSILKMRLHDNTKLYNLDGVTEAEITIIMPSGLTLRSLCTFEDSDVGKLIVFKFEPIHMIEIGTYNIILTVSDTNGKVSVQPFRVRFFDSLSNSDTTIFELIQDLQNKINELEKNVVDTVKQSEKGAPNGVATLDENSKLDIDQVPLEIEDHLKEKIYLTGAHKWRVNEEGMGQYETPDGTYQYIGKPTYSAVDVQRLILDTTVNNSVVTMTFTGIGTRNRVKWIKGNRNISFFMSNGHNATGNNFTIEDIGTYTIFYTDELGNEYLKKIVVDKSQIRPPDVTIFVEYGIVAFISSENFQIRKIELGSHDLAYFETNGQPMAGNSIKVTQAGLYTAYYKRMNGLDYIQEFTVNQSDLDNP